MTRKASLQITSDQITSEQVLYEWAEHISSFTNISVICKSEKEYETTAKFLNEHFKNCKTVTGTQKLHYVMPYENFKLKVKNYSSCPKFEIFNFSKSEPKRAVKQKSC